MGGYVLGLCAMSLICAVLSGLLSEGNTGRLMKWICSVVLLLTVVSPLRKGKLPDLTGSVDRYRRQGEDIAARGRQFASNARNESIKHRVETYILDKAASLGLTLEAEVTLDEDGVPVAVALRGEGSPYARLRLTETIAQELGIAKENQQWLTGN